MKTNDHLQPRSFVARSASFGLLATLFWFGVASGLAQSGGWTNRYSSPYSGPNTSKDQASKVVCDRDGNIIVTGASRGSITFDILTIKYSSAGVPLWTNRYNGPADGDDSGNAVAVDGSGNVLVTGSRTRSLYNLDYYTAKYAAADGALLWEQSYNGPADDNDFAIAVAVDGSGNAVVTGRSYTFESGSFNPDYYTAKYAAADGALLWERRYSGTYSGSIDETSALVLDASGNVIVTGNSTRGEYNADYYTAKYAAADGSVLWEQRYNGPANKLDNASAVAVDESGNVVVTGSSYDSGSVPNLYTAKYAAADGSLVWEQRYSGPAHISDGGTAVAVDGSGNVVVLGGSYNSSFTSDYYTAKYAAANGALLWEKRYNGPANNTDASLAVAVDRSDNVAVTGWSRNSNGYDDYYTAKYAAATGALMAEKRYDGPTHLHDRSAAVAMDRNGDVVVTGSSDAGTASAENLDFVTIKYVLNHSPVVANPIPDRNGLYGMPFIFQFAANAFTDADAGQTLTYSAIGMPPGISFTPATRTFSGTPTNVGTFTVTVTATDSGSPALSTNDVFDLAVSTAPLAVTADNASRPAGQANPTFTGSLVGVVNGDNITATFTTTATPASPPGPYPITPVLADPDNRLGNYTVTTNVGTLTVFCPVVTIEPLGTNLPLAINYVAYSNQFTASGASGPFGFALSTTPPFNPPLGLNSVSSDGLLTGTPSVGSVPLGGSDHTFTVEATNSAGCEASKRYYLHVMPAGTRCADSSQSNLAIPPTGTGGSGNAADDTLRSTILTSGYTASATINHITVAVRLEHPSDGDLVLTLVSPQGERVLLASQRGSGGSNYTETVFFNDAPQSIVNGAPPFGGSFQPEQGLGFAGGTNLNGSWTLEIQDVVAGNAGVLHGWCLALEKITRNPSEGSVYRPNISGSAITTDSGLVHSSSQTYFVNDQTNLICARTLDGGPVWTQAIANATLGRPVVMEQSFGRSPLVLASYGRFALGGAIRALNPANGSSLWTHPIGSCAYGSVGTPEAQLWSTSDGAFRAAYPADDLIFVAEAQTTFSCGNSDNNRIYALRAVSGNVAWTFNAAALLKVGSAEIILDPGRNTLFCWTVQAGSVTTNLWALNTLDGSVRWARDLGPSSSLQIFKPLLANGALYLTINASGNDHLLKINPDTGDTVWDFTLAYGAGAAPAFDPVRQRVIIHVNYALQAVADSGPSATSAWTSALRLVGGVAPVVVPEQGRVYVPTTDPRLYAIDLATGGTVTYVDTGTMASYTDVIADSHNGGAIATALMLLPFERFPIPFSLYSVHPDNNVPGDLAIAGALQPAASGVGAAVTCAFTVTNRSLNAMSPVHVGDVLPPGLSFASVVLSRGTYSLTSNRFAADLGTLPNGTTATISLVVTSTLAGQFQHRAMVGAYIRDLPGTNNSVLFAQLVVANARPVVALPIPDTNGVYGTPFTFQFAADAFTDPDPGQALTYSAGGMPAGIAFTPGTRTFSGIPTSVGPNSVTVTATDNGSPPLSTNDVFDLVIAKAPLTIAAENKSRTYGDTNPPLTLSYTGFVLGETEAVLDLLPAVGTAAEASSPPGNYDMTLSGGADDHYSLTLSNGTLTVTPAPLTLTIDNTNRLSGQTNPVFTGTLAGVVNADNITVTFTSPATESSGPGTYPILPVFSDPDTKLGNYSVATNGGTLTLLPEAITLGPATLPNGLLGVAYSQSLTATGGTAPHTFTLTSGALPGGLTLTGVGLLSGTPGAEGVSAISIGASDAHGCASTNDYSLTILPLPTLTILPADGEVVLWWSTNYPEFQLLCATNLTGAPWATVAPTAVVVGSQYAVTNSIATEQRSYRLQLP